MNLGVAVGCDGSEVLTGVATGAVVDGTVVGFGVRHGTVPGTQVACNNELLGSVEAQAAGPARLANATSITSVMLPQIVFPLICMVVS
jgi:hypothetical protein